MAHNSLIPFIAIGLGTVSGVAIITKIAKLFRRQTIWEFQQGLLYNKGTYVKTLGSGSYWLWTPTAQITVVDVRRSTTTLAGQEIVTADNVGIKFSVLLSFQVIDAHKAINKSQGWYQEVYAMAQVALRDVMSALKVEEILQGRSSLGEKLLEQVKGKTEEFGVEVLQIQIKDVILPAEIRKIFGDVLRAQKEGQAALERARGEHAALRSLANAAKVIENNPTLMSLRILQSLSAQGGATPPQVILNISGGPTVIPAKVPGDAAIEPPQATTSAE